MFSVVHEHRLQEYSTWHAYQTLLKIIHRYKTTIKYKIKIINSLLCWSVTLLMFIQTSNSSHCKFGACQKWEPAGRIGDFGNFLNGFAKSQRLIVLNIDWVQLFWKTVKYCILSEVCMINTAPHSTVSPQMWCITSIYKRLVYTRPDLLARFGKVNLSNAKNSALFVCQA